MDCKKEKSKVIQGLLLLLLFGSFMFWTYKVTQSEQENFYHTLKSFKEGKTLVCHTKLVSKEKGWKLLNESNYIINGDTSYHINMCKVYGE